MKNVLRLLAVAALATTFALPAFAQDTAGAGAGGPCTTEVEAKAALYKKFLDNYKGSAEQQRIASESGREYLTKYGNCPDESDKQIAAFVQKWVGKYEAATAEFNFGKAVSDNPGQAFQLARSMPNSADNLKVQLQLVAAGLNASGKGDKSHNAEAAAAARRALDLVEHGKTSDNWFPVISQQDAPMGLRYYIAAFTFDTAPDEAATQLLKVAQSNSAFSKEAATYQLLGASYFNGEFKRLAAEYKEKYEGKEETPESKALYDRINLVLDRVIDAYARAVALSNGKPQQAALRNTLTTFYKQRHENSEAGLNELVASVLSRPIPVPGQEPAATPAPSSSSSSSGTDGEAARTTPASTATQPAATGTTVKPAPNTGARPASTTTPNSGAKPASTTTPNSGAKPATQRPPV